MIYTPLTKKALAICFQAHRDQRDKSGMPYVFHPFHLAEQMRDERAVCVALLHDVMEDTPTTADELRAAGMPEDVMRALELLRHDPAEPYMSYVERIAADPLARQVKQADLKHNSDLSRLDEVDQEALARVAKYAEALTLLQRPADGRNMLGALVGDMVGSVFEWDNVKSVEFPLFADKSTFTDDSVMTIAVAHALLRAGGRMPDRGAGPSATAFASQAGASESPDGINRVILRRAVVASMQGFGRRYYDAGYGGKFHKWLRTPDPKPYNSWGNGSAMRVSPVGWAARSVEEAELLALETAQVTHNHPEGIKGAQAAAACVFLAREGYDNADIRSYVECNHGYDLGFRIDDIRIGYEFDVSCQGSVPHAIVAFLESDGFEDAIRRAVSIGGDSDTIAAITGGIAHARYGIPQAIADEVRRRLPHDLLDGIDQFCGAYL